jgi:hypothetical protein
MGHYVELQVGRTSSAAGWEVSSDGPDFPLTFAREPRIAELMLFDAGSMVEVDGHRDLISDRASALDRFRRRLPGVRTALAWDPSAGRTLEAFGDFFAAIDWPYVRLDTLDYRIVLTDEEKDVFDRELEFALSALDQPAIATPGQLFGGPGRYTPSWQRLLNFVLRNYYVEGYRAVDAIYNADEKQAAPPLCGTPYYWREENEPGNLLAAYLPRPGALTIPHIARGKALLSLTPQQEAEWQRAETALRAIARDCVDRVKPAEVTRPLDAESLANVQSYLSTHAGSLTATLSKDQKRIARRLCRAMGFPTTAAGIG